MVVASGDVRLPRFLRRDAGGEVDRLYRKHSGEVLRYALLVLHSRADAEDVTQTVFLRALRSIERGERVRTPRNWLIKITHNECRRLLANRKVLIELPDEIAVEPAEPGRAEELRLAMAALPATQRQALVLRELEGRSYAEISQALDVSESAVETLIFRARRALREQIENAMSCEEFATLLDDPSARTRVRAHARVCAACATLDHQSRGRKSALKRIASVFGLPWWGAKLGAVALTTATVAAVAVAVPHDSVRPNTKPSPAPAHQLNLTPLNARQKVDPPAGGTSSTSSRPNRGSAAVVPAAKVSNAVTASTPQAVLPGPEEPAPIPTPPEPGTPQPEPLPSPTKFAPVAAPVATPLPTVTAPQAALPPTPEVPAVTVPSLPTVPTVSVPLPDPLPPTVTVPVPPLNVSAP